MWHNFPNSHAKKRFQVNIYNFYIHQIVHLNWLTCMYCIAFMLYSTHVVRDLCVKIFRPIWAGKKYCNTFRPNRTCNIYKILSIVGNFGNEYAAEGWDLCECEDCEDDDIVFTSDGGASLFTKISSTSIPRRKIISSFNGNKSSAVRLRLESTPTHSYTIYKQTHNVHALRTQLPQFFVSVGIRIGPYNL